MRARLLALAGGLLVALPALCQVPEGEKIPVRDPGALASLGFPADARNVFVWSKANLGARPESPDETDTFGTAHSGYSTVLGFQLEGVTPDFVKIASPTGSGTYCDATSTNDIASAQFQVPEGSVLRFFRFWAFDNDAADDLRFNVYEQCQPDFSSGSPTGTLIGQIETSGSSGHQSDAIFLNNLTARNIGCGYFFQVQFRAGVLGSCKGQGLSVFKARLEWRRQVSPAPAVATFGDVPTSHLYFQAIEALAASGITSGCGGGNFCPAGNVTRGEMAAFLARALGLHFP